MICIITGIKKGSNKKEIITYSRGSKKVQSERANQVKSKLESTNEYEKIFLRFTKSADEMGFNE